MNKQVRRTEALERARLDWSAELDAIVHRRPRQPSRSAGEDPRIVREAFVTHLLESIATSHRIEAPYRHWFLRHCLPDDAVDRILALPLPVPSLGGVSGKREIHNATRTYFDRENRGRFPVCECFCQAFQDRRVTGAIADCFGARLAGCYLRVEAAHDTDGFWLEPHSDLGVKTFTFLLYLSKDPQHATLGTDIYDRDKRHVGTAPFEPNAAMAFVPSDITFHGFERRRIEGVRKSVIVNYVTSEWRAREQLAFPDRPIGA